MSRRLHSPGQVAVIVTLVIATLVGLMSLGVDVGLLYLNQVGFAQLWITTGSWNGDNGIITATLVSGVASNNVPNLASANYGTYTPVLIW